MLNCFMGEMQPRRLINWKRLRSSPVAADEKWKYSLLQVQQQLIFASMSAPPPPYLSLPHSVSLSGPTAAGLPQDPAGWYGGWRWARSSGERYLARPWAKVPTMETLSCSVAKLCNWKRVRPINPAKYSFFLRVPYCHHNTLPFSSLQT